MYRVWVDVVDVSCKFIEKRNEIVIGSITIGILHFIKCVKNIVVLLFASERGVFVCLCMAYARPRIELRCYRL